MCVRPQEPRTGRLEVYKAVLLIFPSVPINAAKECIDEVQAKLKRDFVTQVCAHCDALRCSVCGIQFLDFNSQLLVLLIGPHDW